MIEAYASYAKFLKIEKKFNRAIYPSRHNASKRFFLGWSNVEIFRFSIVRLIFEPSFSTFLCVVQ